MWHKDRGGHELSLGGLSAYQTIDLESAYVRVDVEEQAAKRGDPVGPKQ